MAKRKRPLIGVVFAPGLENKRVLKVETQYLVALEKSGAIPLLVPIYRTGLQPNSDLVSNFDGFVFTGSLILERRREELNGVMAHLPKLLRDVNPLYYDFCSNLYQLAFKANKPILGICRGMQVIAEIVGGKISNIESNKINHLQRARPWVKAHKVIVNPKSKLFEYIGSEAMVNSFHRQHVVYLPKNYKVVARTEDKSIEAFEYTANRFVIGIQFHPEWLKEESKGMLPIFKGFVKEVEDRKANWFQKVFS